MNISLLVEIQAAAENVLAALVFARKSLSVISKTISPFKYVSQLYTHYTAFVNPKSKHKSQFLKERNYSNSTTLHLQWQSQTTDLHLWSIASINQNMTKYLQKPFQSKAGDTVGSIFKSWERHPKEPVPCLTCPKAMLTRLCSQFTGFAVPVWQQWRGKSAHRLHRGVSQGTTQLQALTFQRIPTSLQEQALINPETEKWWRKKEKGWGENQTQDLTRLFRFKFKTKKHQEQRASRLCLRVY